MEHRVVLDQREPRAAAAAQQLGGDNLRFGGEGASTSLSSYGNLEQPFYKSSDGTW